jgi:hypothetical protein
LLDLHDLLGLAFDNLRPVDDVSRSGQQLILHLFLFIPLGEVGTLLAPEP